jgi:protein-L-isoaspartate(D-aspartate) O-methyltransferase
MPAPPGVQDSNGKAGDGFVGWPQFAPHDAIIVTAGSSEVPPALLALVKAGGRLVMPISANTPVEQLIVFTKRLDGAFDRCSLGPVMFVPFTGAGRKPEILATYERSGPLCPPWTEGLLARPSCRPAGAKGSLGTGPNGR